LAGERDELLGPLPRRGHRLLDEDVLAVLQCVLDPLLVQGQGEREVNGVDVGAGEHFEVSGDRYATELRGDAGRLLRITAAHRGELDAAGFGNGGKHSADGDVGAADESQPDR
jgi:hypothetical protein